MLIRIQSETYPLFPSEDGQGDVWAGLHGALGFELSLLAKAPIRFGLDPGLGLH